MGSATQALVNSYLTPSRQLGAISSSQGQVIIPESTTPTENAAVKQQILDTVFPPSQRRNTPGFNTSALQVLTDAMNNGFIRQYYSSDEVAADCAKANKSGITNLQLASKATSLAASGWAALAPSVAALQVVPVVGQIIGGAVAAFAAVSNLLAHHSLAVEQEQTVLCYIVPQVNQAIIGLDSAIALNKISLQDAFNGLDVLHSAYLSNVKAIIQESASTCNAACVIDRGIVALILWKKYQYSRYVLSNPIVQAETVVRDTVSDAVTGLQNTVANATGLPVASSNILLVIIAGVIVFLLLKGL